MFDPNKLDTVRFDCIWSPGMHVSGPVSLQQNYSCQLFNSELVSSVLAAPASI